MTLYGMYSDTSIKGIVDAINYLHKKLITYEKILKLVGILWNRTSIEVVDKFSSTSVDFIRSERELEKHALIWSLICLLSMLRGMLGSVKSKNPKGKGKLGNGKGGIKRVNLLIA